jgi:Deoxyinosine 3''endonuclease (endonuclease V)
MKAQQSEIAAIAQFEDTGVGAPSLVAGVDQAFDGDTVVSAAVLLQSGSLLERSSACVETDVPYMPGLLSFREGAAALASLTALTRRPELVLVDGSGRTHPREAGLATHIGVALGMPTVGVAKSLLCGRPVSSLADPLATGTRVRIEADNDIAAPDGTTVGYAVQTRQYDAATRHINPVYTSPGHRVSATTAAESVEQTATEYKLPDPIHRADRRAAELS